MNISKNRKEKIEWLVETITSGRSGIEELIPVLWDEIKSLCDWYCRRLWLRLPRSFLLEYDDLTQCGYIALHDALSLYSRERAGRFSYFYLFCLHAAIYRENRLTVGGKHKDGRRRFDPVIDASSFRMDAATDDSGEKDGTLLDVLPMPEEGADSISWAMERVFREQLHEALESLLADLPTEEQHIIREVFYKQRDIPKAARLLNISPYEARCIEEHALVNLRRAGQKEGLESFLGDRINYLAGTGLKSFKETGSSATERHAIKRLELEERFKALNGHSEGWEDR